MIGILGGTFDPVHYGHLRPALEVMQATGLDHVRFLPNSIPPHRETPWLDVDRRLKLLKTAIDDQPGFVLDERELHREGQSYMVDTLASMQVDFSAHPICLILGMDAFLGLQQWHQWQRIPELCHLIVTTRPGFEIDRAFIGELPFSLARSDFELSEVAAGRILLQSVTQLDISASKIRKMLASGLSVRYLLPDEVNKQLMKMVKT
ncbi:MAG: nicotinate-nucleotide adenylyltransferase [Gammaproteobacteria bacterium]|jgi:nicotinate-nucleotide adenylyltransferase